MAPEYLYTSPMYDELPSNILYKEIAGSESDIDHYAALRMENNEERLNFY